MAEINPRPPRENLIRALLIPEANELRAGEGEEGAMPTLSGHFAVFNRWAEINSHWEGRFLERISPGAFKKTFQEQRDEIKVLFNHGHDAHIGDKPLGKLTDLREDETGAYYEAPLFDTSYNRDLLPGLQAGVYGASFRFGVVKESVEDSPERSASNPEGIPERTILEARVYEGGPVTFPAYSEATAEVRSLTDEMLFARFAENPEDLRRLLDYLHGLERKARAITTDDLPSSKKDEDKPEAKPPESTPQTEPDDSTPRAGSRTPLYNGKKEQESWRL